jgi:hypothetical protein
MTTIPKDVYLLAHFLCGCALCALCASVWITLKSADRLDLRLLLYALLLYGLGVVVFGHALRLAGG